MQGVQQPEKITTFIVGEEEERRKEGILTNELICPLGSIVCNAKKKKKKKKKKIKK